MYSRTKYLVSIRQGSKGGVLVLFLSLHPQFDNQTACTVPNMKNVISNSRGYESKQPCPPPHPPPHPVRTTSTERMLRGHDM